MLFTFSAQNLSSILNIGLYYIKATLIYNNSAYLYRIDISNAFALFRLMRTRI